MEDPTVRRLTKKVFPHLWVCDKLISKVPSTRIFSFSDMTVFAQGIGNAVMVYLHSYRPTLSDYLIKHIPSMQKSKIHFWTHVAFLCLQAHLTNDNPFDYFLTTCAITAEVSLHCYMNGYDDVLSLASAFFCAFFENELYANFHRSGGWAGLRQYIEDTSCKELHEVVEVYSKKVKSPGEHLPILISIRNEPLAARRREKFMSLSSCKIGEIEREDKTKKLVSRIFHWHFIEIHRISEVRRGILKRTENVRYLTRFMDAERHDELSEADEILDDANKISNDFEPMSLHGEVQLSETVSTMSKARSSNKSVQTLDDSEYKTQESKIPLCNTETSEKTKFSSSSNLHHICKFYESLSSASERKTDDSKYFRSSNERYNRPSSSTVKELANRHEKMNHVGICQSSFVSNSSENGGTFPKSGYFTPEIANKSTEQFRADDALSEFTKSFQELGFKCLCVGNSSHLDEKSANFVNYAEVIEKCRHYQNKYPAIQFAILIPNNCFTNEASHASETENCDAIFSKEKDNEQLLSNITKEYFNNCSVSSQKPHSEIEMARYEATTIDKNQFRLANGLASLQDCAPENIHKSRFVVRKVKENEALQRSRFSVTKVNEGQMISKDYKCLLENKCATEPKTVSRVTITKVNENHPKDGTSLFGENGKNEIKISRFTVMKVDENNSRDEASTSENWKNGTPKTSRFTVTKVDENELKHGACILRRNWSNVRPQTSRFTVTTVSGNQDSLLEQNYSSGISSGTENETVHFQANGSVKYQKRVSFAELPSIAYYSKDEFLNSRESLNQNSPEETKSAKNSKHSAKQVDTLNPPTPRNPLGSQRRKWFRFSSRESRSSIDNAASSDLSSSSGFFSKILRLSSSSNSKVDESPTKNKEETDKQKIEDLEKSLEAAGVEDPVVFKV